MKQKIHTMDGIRHADTLGSEFPILDVLDERDQKGATLSQLSQLLFFE